MPEKKKRSRTGSRGGSKGSATRPKRGKSKAERKPVEDPRRNVEATPLRPFWSGTISFGLVSIPVDVFPAHRSGGGSLRMLTHDGEPLRRVYYCPREGRDVAWDELVRGYALDDGSFVVVTDAELEDLEPDKTRAISLEEFVDRSEIPPLAFLRGYYLSPGGETRKAYDLLAATMERAGKAGVATFVMRGKEYVIAIFAEGGLLRAETLRFADELRSASDIGLPSGKRVAKKEVDRLTRVIERLAEDAIDPDTLVDERLARLRALVEEKRRKGTGVVEAATETEPAEGERPIDLLEELKRRLAHAAPSNDVALKSMSKQALYERAKELDIEGRSHLSKDELAAAIERVAS